MRTAEYLPSSSVRRINWKCCSDESKNVFFDTSSLSFNSNIIYTYIHAVKNAIYRFLVSLFRPLSLAAHSKYWPCLQSNISFSRPKTISKKLVWNFFSSLPCLSSSSSSYLFFPHSLSTFLSLLSKLFRLSFPFPLYLFPVPFSWFFKSWLFSYDFCFPFNPFSHSCLHVFKSSMLELRK